MKSTGKDVARLAAVSVATVSRVLSGSNQVKPETRERVMAAMKLCNYEPNEHALAISRLASLARRGGKNSRWASQ
jgi:LacI family transcriptional regulator